eukprot:1146869-Pelagomonas_calceolata.AAC.1
MPIRFSMPKLVTTRGYLHGAIENNNTYHSLVLEPGASSDPPDPIYSYFKVPWLRGFTGEFSLPT